MSPEEESPATRVANLLKRLQAQPEAVRTMLQGRAVSRSEGHLHLATSTGLVAVPVGDIEDVRPLLPLGDPTLVSVSVKDTSKVRHLLKVELTDAAGAGAGDEAGQAGAQAVFRRGSLGRRRGFGNTIDLPPIFACGSFTSEYLDTTTASGGVLDATDDVIDFINCDDYNR